MQTLIKDREYQGLDENDQSYRYTREARVNRSSEVSAHASRPELLGSHIENETDADDRRSDQRRNNDLRRHGVRPTEHRDR